MTNRTAYYSSSVALSLAGITNRALNELVCEQIYNHAPQTTAGKARLWKENDIIALMVFKYEILSGVSRRRAALVSNATLGFLEDFPDENVIEIAIGRSLIAVAVGAKGEFSKYSGISFKTYNLAALRQSIRNGKATPAIETEILPWEK